MSAWNLVYDRWIPEQEPLRETLCTLGNGYFCTRGAAEEAKADTRHYPGTYVAGGYNRLKSTVGERIVEHEDLVNWPNWLSLNFRLDAGEWFALNRVEPLEYHQDLDLKHGVLERRVGFRDQDGRISTIVTRRLVHMADPHLAAIEWKLTPVNWSGRITIRCGLDGNVANRGVARYRDLNERHVEIVSTEASGEHGVGLLARSNQSHLCVAQAARARLFLANEESQPQRQYVEEGGFVGHDLVVDGEKKQAIRVEKVVALFTSRDHAISEPLDAAKRAVRRAGPFDELRETHARAWSQLWQRCDIELDDAPDAQRILRLHIFHLLQTVSRNTTQLDCGVPARGWHGEAYRGHIFWDELFILPFLNYCLPDVTRSLLMYRYRRLDEARRAAKEAGYSGAMYPWQSGSTGREENQVVHLNPRSGRWLPDHTHLQRHINAAIAYNIWQYVQSTGDTEFLSSYGAELILEIARFWASLATYNADTHRYEIHGVVGPDEYHTGYPVADEPGLNNNAYTNVMAVWTLRTALRVPHLLADTRRAELLESLGISDAEFARWDDITRKMRLVFHEDGVISQFDGWEQLEEFDWEGYRRRYGDIHRLDRILEAEGDTPNRYKCAKQADVLMLFYLFSSEELTELFDQMGYPFDPAVIPRTIDYYHQRTSHGSTLSRVVHAWVLARSNRSHAVECFEQALRNDMNDVQGGSTAEGIHLGAMVGTVDIVQRCFTGIRIVDDVLWLDPAPHPETRGFRLRLRFRGHWFRLHLTRTRLVVESEKSGAHPVQIGCDEQIHTVEPGDEGLSMVTLWSKSDTDTSGVGATELRS